MKSTDRRILDQLRHRMRLPWRVRPAGGSAVNPGIHDTNELPVMVVGPIRTARTPEQQAEMVRYAAVAATMLPALLTHCIALEEQLRRGGLELTTPWLADEILAMLELAGFAEEIAPDGPQQ